MKEIISAEIWLVNNTYYIRAYSITTAGMGYAAGNPVHIVTVENVYTLGSEALKTLEECKMGVPHPDHRVHKRNEMLDIIGMKTDKELMKKGKLISVYLKGEKLEIHPLVFNGKYMTGSPDHKDTYSSLDPEEITKTILTAFEALANVQK